MPTKDAKDKRANNAALPFGKSPAAPRPHRGANGAATATVTRKADPGPDAAADDDLAPRPVSGEAMDRLAAAAAAPGVGGAFEPDPAYAGAVAFTHFDAPASENNALTVLLPKETMGKLPAQSLVRIRSPKDDADPGGSRDRDYLGVVVAGPFAEPDGLRADASIVVATTVSGHGQVFLPRYHGRALVEILGEIDPDDTGAPTGRVMPPQHRPRPSSPVFPLDDEQTAHFLNAGGGRPADARLGVMVGRERVAVSVPTDAKHVLPRHTAVLGTTGGGKSTTVAGLVHQLQRAGVATVVIDVEGEYTDIDQPADDPAMLAALRRRGILASGVGDHHVLHPVGRETSREGSAARVHSFSLRFSELSPYSVTELLEMPDAQQERFLKLFDATRALLRDLKFFPATRDEEDQLAALDELETGYPRMTLSHLIDVAGVFAHAVARDEGEPPLYNDIFAANRSRVREKVHGYKSSHEFSWRGLIGRLHRVNRLKIFDNPAAPPLRYAGFLEPGRVSVVDLSDTDEPQVRNLVIADLLRGVQREQEEQVRRSLAAGRPPTPVVVVIEEAHEFLSAQRLKQMPTLFQQVARIARRGRKRWLGLVFVTQLPQHLPDEALGLINNFILHKISDAGVIDRLRKSITGLDRAQWATVPGLAPGQAVVSLTSLTRPLLVSIDPAPCRLRLVE